MRCSTLNSGSNLCFVNAMQQISSFAEARIGKIYHVFAEAPMITSLVEQCTGLLWHTQTAFSGPNSNRLVTIQTLDRSCPAMVIGLEAYQNAGINT
jgi:hypothetical protein